MLSESAIIEDSNRCSICGTELQGQFCHSCGQKVTHKQPGSREVIASLFGGLLTIERGFVGIMRDMTLRPRKVIENYWAGNRYYYLSPGQLIFYAVFVAGLHMAFVEPGILGFDVSLSGVERPAQTLVSPQIIFIVFLLPMFAVTTFLSFLRRKLSFAKHFVGATYIFAYSIIVCTILFDLLQIVLDIRDGAIGFFFLLMLFIWGSRVLTAKKKWFHYLAVVLIQIVVFFVLQTVIWGSLYLFYPDGFNLQMQ